MPGLTLASASDSSSVRELLQSALEPASYEGYSGTRLWKGDKIQVVATTYPGYPFKTFDTAEYWICLDGGLYGVPPHRVRPRLERWAENVLGPGNTSLPKDLLHTDGDFVALFIHKSTSDWAVVKDGMGRLPLYLYAASSRICLTRDFHLFNRLDEPPSPDRLGAAQQLTFGYPLGRRTLRQNVQRVSPGTVLHSGPSPTAFRKHQITEYNFDAPRRHANRSVSENAAQLVERLDEDVQARCRWSDGPSLLALSGGLDSRAIACSLMRTNCSFEATTFSRPHDRNASDVDHAKQIAECFGLSHEVIELPPRTSQHLQSLLWAKGGLNPFDVSYMIPYLEALTDGYDEGAHLLTGNGGALLRDLQPPHPLRNTNDLLRALLDKAWLSPEAAAQLVDIPPERLLESVHDRLSAYPESSLSAQYVHFRFERLFKYSFEGEDRNRSYLWSSAPYHGLHFTRYALHCPYDQKENYGLYRAFLRALSPRSLQVGYSNFYGLRMTALQYNVYRSLRWIVRQFPNLREWLNRHRGRRRLHSSQAVTPGLLREHLASTDCPVLNLEKATQLARHPERTSAHALDNVLTVASALQSSPCLLKRHAR